MFRADGESGVMKSDWLRAEIVLIMLFAVVVLAIFGSPGSLCGEECPTRVGFESFGEANQPANDVAVVGNEAYTADSYGLTIYDISDPALPQKLGEILASDMGSKISVSGNRAFVITSYGYLRIYDISDPMNPIYLSRIAPENHEPFRDVIARGDTVYLTRDEELSIYDVADPLSPTYLGGFFYDSISDIESSGDFIYVASGDGVVILDVADPAHPLARGLLPDSRRADTVGAGGGLAVVGVVGGVLIVDISNPDAPQSVGSYETTGDPTHLSVVNQAACIAEGNTLEILDLSNPSEPLLVSSTEMDTEIESLTVDGNRLYICLDELGLRILDLFDPGRPTEVGSISAEGSAWDLVISESIAFVADGRFGLQIVDVSDPENPELLAGYRLPGFAWSVAVEGNIALVADGTAGLMILDISNRSTPEVVGSYDSPGEARKVILSDRIAYLADGASGLAILDVHDPVAPELLGSWSGWWSEAVDLAKIGDILYLAFDEGLPQVFDVSDLHNPLMVSTQGAPAFSQETDNIEVAGSLTFSLEPTFGSLLIYDVSDPLSPFLRSWLELYHRPGGLQVFGDAVYVATRDWSLEKISIVDPAQPVLISETQTRASARNVALDPLSHTAWLAEGSILEGINVGCAACSSAELQVDPASILTGGALSTISLYLEDSSAHPAPGQVVEGRSDLGTLSVFEDLGDGHYRAFLSSGDLSGTATIRIYINGEECSSTGTVVIVCASGAVDAPGAIEAHAVNEHAIQLNWASVSGAVGYRVFRDASMILELDSGVTSFLDTGLASSTEYSYSVASLDNCGGSSISEEIGVRTEGAAPICPVQGRNFPVDYLNRRALSVLGNLAYVGILDGIEILDVSDPSAVEMIGEWRHDGGEHDCEPALIVSDGIAYLFGDQLDVVDVSDPRAPERIETVDWCSFESVVDLRISDHKLYIATSYDNFSILDLTNPRHPTLLGSSSGVYSDNYSLAVNGDYLYLSNQWPGLAVYDVSDPAQPALLASIQLDGGKIVASGGYLYVSGAEYFQVLDISDPALPVLGDRISVAGGPGACLYGAGSYAAVSGGHMLSSIDLSNPGHPVLKETIETSTFLLRLQSSETTVFGLGDGLEVFPMDCPPSPRSEDSWSRAR